MHKVKLVSVFVLLALLLGAWPGMALADEPGPPIDPPPEAAEGGPTLGSLIDVVTSDTSGEIRTSGAGVLSSPGLLGWSLLGWNWGWVYGDSKTEITAGDGYLYQLTVRSFLSASGGCSRSSYDDHITLGSKAGDEAHAYPDAVWRVGCSDGSIHGEHSVVRCGSPPWSWWDTTDIHHTF